LNAGTPKLKEDNKMTFEVLTAVLMKGEVFWRVTSCRLVSTHRRVEGTSILLNVCREQSAQRNFPEDKFSNWPVTHLRF
jgi:hypothetical protein